MNPNAPFCSRFTDANYDRKRQIDTVKVFNDNVSEITQNTEYSVEFTAGENKLAMLIILGPDFPMDKPLLKITPSISHQWVNENSEIVSAPGYLNFSIHSDLGRVVHVIIRELQRNPPPLKQKESPSIYMNNSNSQRNDNTETPSLEEYEQSFEVMSSVIGRLHKMSLDELRKMEEDNDSLDRFVSELPHIRSMKQTVVDMNNATEELERRKTDLEFKIKEYKPEIEKKQKELEVYKANCKSLYDKSLELTEIRSPVNVKKRLKQSGAMVDAESELVAENFLDSNISLNEFLSQYNVLRMKVHEMKMKEERINGELKMDKNKLS